MAQQRKKGLLARLTLPPLMIIAGVMALWENEGRFDYHQAARDALVIGSPAMAGPGTTIALTGRLDTGIAVQDSYLEVLTGYHVVTRRAEIYAWRESTDSEGRTTWRQGWYSHLENNSRNNGLVQTLSSGEAYPAMYRLDDMVITPRRIHLVDDAIDLPPETLTLNEAGRRAGLHAEGEYFYRRLGSGTSLGDERLRYSAIAQTPTATYFGLIEAGEGVGKQHDIKRSFISGIIGNDGILHHLVNGPREQALDTVKAHLRRLKWIVRGGGTVAIVMGIFLFFSGFVNLLYRIPVLGRMVSSGVFLVSLVLGLLIAITVILASVFVHHPLVAAVPTVLVILAVVVLRRRQTDAGANARATLQRHQPATTGLSVRHGADSGYTPAEAMFVHLARIALATDGLDEKEKRFLVAQGRKSDIAPKRMKALLEQAEAKEGEVPAATREDILVAACLAMADGSLSSREVAHLIAMGRRAGLSGAEVRAIIIEAESANGDPAPA